MEHPSRAEIQKWVRALRSGKYTQTQLSLQDTNGYCCLGVACREFIPESKLEYNIRGRLSGGLPHEQGSAPLWLKLVNEKINSVIQTLLTQLNDGFKHCHQYSSYTFDEIADILELIYFHSKLLPLRNE